jgi:trehalose 6-phosphate synthase
MIMQPHLVTGASFRRQSCGPIAVAHRLVVVSNRVSVPNADAARRAGGLEVALRPALERNGGVWFGWSGKAVPRADVGMHTVSHKNVTYVVTDLSVT